MGQQQPNQIARTLAIGALILGFLLFVATIATSGGGDDSGDDDSSDPVEAESSGPTPRGERAIAEGVWIVREGDTLNAISVETGIDADELIELNPEIDAQVLTTGQRISLRAGGADEGPDASESAAGLGEDDEPGPSGSGVGDEGPTGTPETTTDESP
jgi:LysM repeat protein